MDIKVKPTNMFSHVEYVTLTTPKEINIFYHVISFYLSSYKDVTVSTEIAKELKIVENWLANLQETI